MDMPKEVNDLVKIWSTHFPNRNFYTWAKEQGANIELLSFPMSIMWESESRKVEFYLRWI